MLLHGRGMDIAWSDIFVSVLLLTISRNQSKREDNLTYKSGTKHGKNALLWKHDFFLINFAFQISIPIHDY